MFNKKYKLLNETENDTDFWPSFTDLLSTILLVVLLILMAIILNIHNQSKADQAQIKAQQEAIEAKEKQIEMLTGVRKDIVSALEKEFSKTKLGIEVDKETGAIKFNNDLLFETGKDVVRKDFKTQLQQFVPLYFNILYSGHKDYIAEIVVEGHTDDVGSYMDNLDLSQRRAFSVVRYILSDEFGSFDHKELVRQDITANGRSFSDPKYKKGTKEINREKSRRVEFKFRLKNISDVNGNEVVLEN